MGIAKFDDLSDRIIYIHSAIAIAALTYIIYQRKCSPLAAVPGPFLASLTSLWVAHAYRRGDFHRYVIELHQQYGPIVRVAPDSVSVSDVNAIKIIYGSGSKFWKGKWYKHLGTRGNWNLLSMFDEPRHKRIRHLVEPLYSLRSVRESEELMSDPIEHLVDGIRKKNGESFEIIDYLNAFAVDAFTTIIYGERYGLMENGQLKQLLEFTEKNWKTYFWAAMLPPLGKLVKIYQQLTIVANVILSGGKAPLPILAWTAKKIEGAMKDEKASNATAPNLLDKFVELHRNNPQEYPKEALDGSMFEVVFAGFETCGASMPKMIWRITTTDGCQERLQKELDTVKNESEIKGLLPYDELRRLPYLSACLSESMRIDPITGINLSRTVPSDGVQMNGYYLPGGTEIGINPWVISYNEDVMIEPNQFRPERWLNATKEQKTKMDRMDLFFSAGPSSCPGRDMARVLLYKTIAVIFSNFNVAPEDPNQKIREINMFPVKWRNVRMKLTERE